MKTIRHLLLSTICIFLFPILHVFGQKINYPEKTWQAASSKVMAAWNADKLNEIRKFAETNETKALLIIQNGELVLDWGETNKNFHIFSCRKSLLSGLYGIYSDNGIINTNATLEELDIDDQPDGLTKQEKKAQIKDLLKSRSGVYHKAAFETPGMENNRPKRGSFKPNEHWFYNNWDFNSLTTIFEKVTQKKVFDAFEEEFAIPLQMENFDKSLLKYHRENVSVHPATLYYLSAKDFARVGLLFQSKGIWKGKQIISEDWVNESLKVHSDNGFLGGYGYCWWVANKGEHYPHVKLPEGTFSARGTGEQNMVVVPEYNLIIVHLTLVTSPQDQMMHVVTFGKLLKTILEARN